MLSAVDISLWDWCGWVSGNWCCNVQSWQFQLLIQLICYVDGVSENWRHFVWILKNWSYYSCAISMTHYAAAAAIAIAIACCKPYYHGCCGCTQCGRGFIECRPKDWNFIACSVTTWEELLLWVSYKTSANVHDKWQNIQVAGHVTEWSPISPKQI